MRQFSSFQIVFVAIARFLMQINSCLNPFVYATTIPAFRKIVNWLFKNRCHLNEDGKAKMQSMKNISNSTTQLHSVRPNTKISTPTTKA